jgi:NAD(P)-dependent dehydrogenase (short-subunit alcohol dehydrogenase family)
MLARDQGGSIIITSSTAGLKGVARTPNSLNAGLLGYTAAKHGVLGLMKLYANALAPNMIRVNTVHPTAVNTPMVVNDQFPRWVDDHPELGDAIVNAMPVQLIEAVDISNAIVYLASDDGRYVTNVSLPVDAGFSRK